MERNIPLLRAVLTQITEHPETHDQKHWYIRGAKEPAQDHLPMYASCGTRACVAGWAVLLGDPQARPICVGRHGASWGVISQHGVERYYNEYGAQLLGLTLRGSVWLFAEDRTRDEVLQGLRDLIDGVTDLGDPLYDPDEPLYDEDAFCDGCNLTPEQCLCAPVLAYAG